MINFPQKFLSKHSFTLFALVCEGWAEAYGFLLLFYDVTHDYLFPSRNSSQENTLRKTSL